MAKVSIWMLLILASLFAPSLAIKEKSITTYNFDKNEILLKVPFLNERYDLMQLTENKICFDFHAFSEVSQSNDEVTETFVLISVIDYVPFKVNFDRLGGTSTEKGTQTLSLKISDSKSRNIIRKSKAVSDGKTLISFLTTDKNKSIEICLENTITDLSWRATNTDKIVSIELFDRDMMNKRMQTWYNRNYKDNSEVLYKEITQKFKEVTLGKSFLNNQLLFLENQHRNLNEAIFTKLIATVIVLITFLASFNLISTLILYNKKLINTTDIFQLKSDSKLRIDEPP